MSDEGKKAGAIAGGVLAAIGAFAARSVDDCARVGARTATHGAETAFVTSGDDLARLGVRSADDLAGVGAGRYGAGVDLAGLTAAERRAALIAEAQVAREGGAGAHLVGAADEGALGARGAGDGVAVTVDEGAYGAGEGVAADGIAQRVAADRASRGVAGRPSVGSFGGGAFGRGQRPAHAVALTDDAMEELTELAIDVGLDATEEAAWWVADAFGEDEDVPLVPGGVPFLPPLSVRVVALAGAPVPGADRTVRDLAQLDAILSQGDEYVIVVAPEAGLASRRLRAPDGASAPASSALVRRAAIGSTGAIVLCEGHHDVDGCLAAAVDVARRASAPGPDDVVESLERARDASPRRSRIALLRLRPVDGGLALATSPPRYD